MSKGRYERERDFFDARAATTSVQPMPEHERYSAARRTRSVCGYNLARRTELVTRWLSELEPRSSRRVIDIGSADGLMLAALKDRLPTWEFVGVEANAALCEEADKTGVSVVHADGRHLPFDSGEFDVVLVCATLKHVQDYQALLSECRRVSVDDARLLVLDPTPLGVYIGVLMGHFDRRYLPNVWSLRQSRKRLADEGYRVIRATRYVLSPYPIMGVERLEKALGAMHLPNGIWQQALLAEKVTRT